MSEVEDLFKKFQADYSEARVEVEAREHAAKDQPPLDSDYIPYEGRIHGAAQGLVDTISKEYKNRLETCGARCRAMEKRVSDEHASKQLSIANVREAETRKAQTAPELVEAERRFNEAKDRFERRYAELNRLPIAYIPHWFYILLALVIGIGEIPLNALVFSIFGEAIILNYVLGGVIGLVVVLGAHFIGLKFREHGYGFSWANALKGIAALAVLVGLFYAIAIMRRVYLGEVKEDLGLTDLLVDASFQFFWVNVAILSTAIIIAYLAHDSVPGYERLYDDYRKRDKELERLKKKQQEELLKIEQKSADAMAKADRARNYQMEDARQIAGEYDRLLIKGQEKQKEVNGLMLEAINTYRQENLSHRPDKSVPRAFNSPPSYPLELSLSSLQEMDA